jgi:hypothetical protein
MRNATTASRMKWPVEKSMEAPSATGYQTPKLLPTYRVSKNAEGSDAKKKAEYVRSS